MATIQREVVERYVQLIGVGPNGPIMELISLGKESRDSYHIEPISMMSEPYTYNPASPLQVIEGLYGPYLICEDSLVQSAMQLLRINIKDKIKNLEQIVSAHYQQLRAIDELLQYGRMAAHTCNHTHDGAHAVAPPVLPEGMPTADQMRQVAARVNHPSTCGCGQEHSEVPNDTGTAN